MSCVVRCVLCVACCEGDAYCVMCVAFCVRRVWRVVVWLCVALCCVLCSIVACCVLLRWFVWCVDACVLCYVLLCFVCRVVVCVMGSVVCRVML